MMYWIDATDIYLAICVSWQANILSGVRSYPKFSFCLFLGLDFNPNLGFPNHSSEILFSGNDFIFVFSFAAFPLLMAIFGHFFTFSGNRRHELS